MGARSSREKGQPKPGREREVCGSGAAGSKEAEALEPDRPREEERGGSKEAEALEPDRAREEEQGGSEWKITDWKEGEISVAKSPKSAKIRVSSER